jgi:L-fuconolactonase
VILDAAARIDAHQHFWRYDAQAYPWIGGAPALARDWLPEDLAPQLQAAGMAGCIAVQARECEAETDFLLGLAAEHPWILGVVGWVELRHGDVSQRLARWDGQAKLRGMRHVLQGEADVAGVVGSETFRRNVAVLQRAGLVYDVLINAGQFAGVAEFCAALDGHALVLDHIAKPRIGGAGFAEWRGEMARLAALPHVFCKLSGLVTEAQAGAPAAAFAPYLDAMLALFGPKRLMFGSDWPVCLLEREYGWVHGLIAGWAAKLSAAEQAAVWGGNARACYGIG